MTLCLTVTRSGRTLGYCCFNMLPLRLRLTVDSIPSSAAQRFAQGIDFDAQRDTFIVFEGDDGDGGASLIFFDDGAAPFTSCHPSPPHPPARPVNHASVLDCRYTVGAFRAWVSRRHGRHGMVAHVQPDMRQRRLWQCCSWRVYNPSR